jgi:5-(carboxyamino)imidazole ribonucleotide synthase
MLLQEAANYDVRVAILDPSPDAPCASMSHEFVCGSFQDYDTVMAFGKGKDVMSVEIEHVNTDALEAHEKSGVEVYPKPSFLRMVQDKGLQKQFYAANAIPTAPFRQVRGKSEENKTKYPAWDINGNKEKTKRHGGLQQDRRKYHG